MYGDVRLGREEGITNQRFDPSEVCTALAIPEVLDDDDLPELESVPDQVEPAQVGQEAPQQPFPVPPPGSATVIWDDGTWEEIEEVE